MRLSRMSSVWLLGQCSCPTLLTNLNLNESKKITSDSSDTQELGFATDLTSRQSGRECRHGDVFDE